MKTLRFFSATYIGATDRRGARVCIRDLRYDKRKHISYDYRFDSACDIAIDYLSSKGIDIAYRGENLDTTLLGTEDFDIQI